MASSDGLSAKDVRPEGPGRFRLRSISEIAEDSFREDLIEGLVPARALGQLYGASSSGKSFLAQDMACCMASGAQFHGREVMPGNVLYIAAEGVTGLPDRIRAWNGGEVPSADSPLNTRIRVLSDQLDLNNPSDVKALLEIASQLDPLRFVFVDTLSRCMSGDENSSRDMNQVVRACSAIKAQTGATVILIHHSGWQSPRERGSSVLRAATDFTLRAEKVGSKVTLSCVKMRDGSPPEPMHFELAEVTWKDKDGLSKKSCRLRSSEAAPRSSQKAAEQGEQAVCRAFAASPGRAPLSKAQVATATGTKPWKALGLIKALIAKGWATPVEGGKNTKYELTPTGWEHSSSFETIRKSASSNEPGPPGDSFDTSASLKEAAYQTNPGLERSGASNGSATFFPNVKSSEAGGASSLSEGPEAESPDGWGSV